MRVSHEEGQLIVSTNVYQAKSGAIYLNWGNTVIKLAKEDAEAIARDIPDFDQGDYNFYYNKQSSV